jgi:hypothetical protein
MYIIDTRNVQQILRCRAGEGQTAADDGIQMLRVESFEIAPDLSTRFSEMRP